MVGLPVESPELHARSLHSSIYQIHPPHAQILNLLNGPRTALRLPIVRSEDTNLPSLLLHPPHLVLSQPEHRSPRIPMPRPSRENVDSPLAELPVVVFLASVLVADIDKNQILL